MKGNSNFISDKYSRVFTGLPLFLDDPEHRHNHVPQVNKMFVIIHFLYLYTQGVLSYR